MIIPGSQEKQKAPLAGVLKMMQQRNSFQKGGQSTKVQDNPELAQVKSSDHSWKTEETGKGNGVFRAQWIKSALCSEEHLTRPAVTQEDSALWEACQSATQSGEKQGRKRSGLPLLLHSILLSAPPSLSFGLSQTRSQRAKRAMPWDREIKWTWSGK